jgi:hypothetical protein
MRLGRGRGGTLDKLLAPWYTNILYVIKTSAEGRCSFFTESSGKHYYSIKA